MVPDIRHYYSPCADPSTDTDASLLVVLILSVHRLGGVTARVLVTPAENLNMIGEHRFGVDFGKSNRAESTDVCAIAQRGFVHRKKTVPSEVSILSTGC